ncbi:phosphoribosyltransferase family protein [Nocardioides rubriscoriae]|uniref:phosphoribosyltransferase family protein n=1 Tax=Nocardioides rubriscoriae TaxID=642762 RepID=UPI001B865BBE|nr:phosphoribosyltransferase family protein [Nocardioides rubriscoriae]
MTPRPPVETVWSGDWVCAHAGVELVSREGSAPVEELVGLAVRRNPRRVHLVVSTVLAKHVPVAPSVARRHGSDLGGLVEDALDGARAELVLGYAETATGLGHLVADRLAATALHSTRRPGWSALSFEEEHSHATTHRLQPRDLGLLDGRGPLVLVDDELTTGRTILNTVRELHAISPRPAYVVAALVDLRPDAARATAAEVAAELGTSITFVALLEGEVRTVREPDHEVRAAVAADPAPATSAPERAVEVATTYRWPAGVPDGGRHGLGPADADGFETAVVELGEEVGRLVAGSGSVHVLGTEELMYLPHRLAEHLEATRPALAVTVSSTTRSPVVVRDDPAYAVRHGLTFPAHDGAQDGRPRFAYNLEPGRFDTIVLVLDEATPVDGAVELRAALRTITDRLVVVRVAGAGA